MHAIWAAYMPEQQLENGILWEDDVPEMIRAVVKAVRGMRDDAEPVDASAVVSGVGEQHRQNMPEDGMDNGKPSPAGRRVGHLRVVK